MTCSVITTTAMIGRGNHGPSWHVCSGSLVPRSRTLITGRIEVRCRPGCRCGVARNLAVKRVRERLRVAVRRIRALLTVVADVRPKQGESVIALGAPRGLSGSVSDGIVSAIRNGHELSDLLSGVYRYILERYIKLVNEHRGNLRAVLQAIEAGAMQATSNELPRADE